MVFFWNYLRLAGRSGYKSVASSLWLGWLVDGFFLIVLYGDFFFLQKQSHLLLEVWLLLLRLAPFLLFGPRWLWIVVRLLARGRAHRVVEHLFGHVLCDFLGRVDCLSVHALIGTRQVAILAVVDCILQLEHILWSKWAKDNSCLPLGRFVAKVTILIDLWICKQIGLSLRSHDILAVLALLSLRVRLSYFFILLTWLRRSVIIITVEVLRILPRDRDAQVVSLAQIDLILLTQQRPEALFFWLFRQLYRRYIEILLFLFSVRNRRQICLVSFNYVCWVVLHFPDSQPILDISYWWHSDSRLSRLTLSFEIETRFNGAKRLSERNLIKLKSLHRSRLS